MMKQANSQTMTRLCWILLLLNELMNYCCLSLLKMAAHHKGTENAEDAQSFKSFLCVISVSSVSLW
jgi:hypothetical protein